MPVTTDVPDDAGKHGHLFLKNKWRSKRFAGEGLFGKAVDDRESNEDDVAHFLGNSARANDGRAPIGGNAPREAAQGLTLCTNFDVDLPPPPENVYYRAKPRRNKGLQVSFTTKPPELIGEGGDEAGTPSIFVSTKKPPAGPVGATATSPQRSHTDSTEDLKREARPEGDGEQSAFVIDVAQKGLRPHKSLPRPPKDVGDIHPVALHRQPPILTETSPSTSPVLRQRDNDSHSGHAHMQGPREDYLSLDLPSPTNLTGNSLTPRASPEPVTQMSDTFTDASHEDVPAYPREIVYGSRPSSPESKHITTLGHASDGLRADRGPSPQESREPSPRPSLHASLNPTAGNDTKQISLRSVAKGLGLDALDEFDLRVQRFYAIFGLGIEVQQDPMSVTFERWIRTASWWFLKGRGELESALRNRPQSAGSDSSGKPSQVSRELKQAYVDLAKSWWIVKTITPSHPEIRRYGAASVNCMAATIDTLGNHELASLAKSNVSLVANLRALALSMKRNDKLPSDTLEIQDLDVRVLLDNPEMPREAVGALACRSSSLNRTFQSGMPLGDTEAYFTFSRLFGVGSVASKHGSREAIAIPCALCLFRAKETFDLTALIMSQDDSINLNISTEKQLDNQLTWKDVNWSTTGNFISIAVSHEVNLSILFSDQDFKALWNISDYTRKVQKDFQGRRGEEVVFEARLYDFQCLRSGHHASSFPPNPIRDCKIRLFSKVKAFEDGTGSIHTGCRLMARTPPAIKSLSSISQDYGDDMPTLFGFGPREDRPRLAVRMPGLSTFVATFQAWEDLDLFYNMFTQRQSANDEFRSPALALKDLRLATENETANDNITHVPGVRWQQLKVLSQRPKDNDRESVRHLPILRIVAQCNAGILTDHFSLAPGDLQMSLGVDHCNEVKFLRPAQRDLFMALTDYGLSDEMIESWRGMLRAVGRSNVIKSYYFQSLSDLHIFQKLVTGFEVVYEGVATNFAISRRRKGVPIHKWWEADFARLQLLRREKTIQLVAFFKAFNHGSCMNFVLKVTDAFESSFKSDQHVLRMVDAKFALPKAESNPSKDFVCLDTPEYPSEHDDIMIAFDDEDERDKFASLLPGETSKASKMGSLDSFRR